jgi:hypothetical protein
MDPIYVLGCILLAGVVLWAVNKLVPMEAKYKQVFNVLAILFLCLWLLTMLIPGLMGTITGIRIGSQPILNVLGVIAALGLILWAIHAIVPMQPKYRQALDVLAVVLLVVWLVSLFVPSLGHHVGH